MILIEAQPLDRHDPDAPPPGLLSNRRFLALAGVLAFAIFSMYIAQPLTPNFLQGVRGLSLSQTGLVFTAGALGNSLMAIFLSRLNDPRRGYLVAQAMVLLFAFTIWKATALPYFALGYFLLGGFRASRPMVMAQARELVHESQMGLTYGVMETVNAVVLIVTPPIAGFLFERDPLILYPLAIGLIAASIVLGSIFLPRKARHA